MIVSVPHTGTRTLIQQLGVVTFFHFCQNERDFEPIREPIDFPIRDPLATSLSWRKHQSDRTDFEEFNRWEKAISYLNDYEPGVTIHRIEDLPKLDGVSGGEWWFDQALKDHDIDALTRLPEVQYLLDWYPRHEDFFKPHYQEGFWWQKNTTPSS